MISPHDHRIRMCCILKKRLELREMVYVLTVISNNNTQPRAAVRAENQILHISDVSFFVLSVILSGASLLSGRLMLI